MTEKSIRAELAPLIVCIYVGKIARRAGKDNSEPAHVQTFDETGLGDK